MAKVLYGVSPIGLGHATRALVISRLLTAAGADVRLFSGGKAEDFLKSEGLRVDDIVSDPVPEVVGGEMKRTSLWYLRSWAALRKTTPRTEKLFDEYRPDLVVCDEEFSGVTVAIGRKCRNAFVSDELELGFARNSFSRMIERRVERWYRRLQDSVDLLLIPDFGQDAGNRWYVEPIVREVTRTKAQVLVDYALPSAGKMVLFCMSGSGIGGFLLEKVVSVFRQGAISDTYLTVTGNRGRKVEGEGVFDLGVVKDNQNLIAAADLVVSTAGKSTIDEAASSGTPIIAVPIRHHAEQERNAAALGYSADDAERLADLISRKIGGREAPREFRGAERASRLLISML